LGDTLVTNAGLVHLRGLTALEELDLRGVNVNDSGLEALSSLARLRKLDLSGAAVTDAGSRGWPGLHALEQINLYRTGVTNAAVDTLLGWPKLRWVDLRYSRASEAGVERLTRENPGWTAVFVASGAPSLPRPPVIAPMRATPRSPPGCGRPAARPSSKADG
jgi:hypothetical protein